MPPGPQTFHLCLEQSSPSYCSVTCMQPNFLLLGGKKKESRQHAEGTFFPEPQPLLRLRQKGKPCLHCWLGAAQPMPSQNLKGKKEDRGRMQTTLLCTSASAGAKEEGESPTLALQLEVLRAGMCTCNFPSPGIYKHLYLLPSIIICPGVRNTIRVWESGRCGLQSLCSPHAGVSRKFF